MEPIKDMPDPAAATDLSWVGSVVSPALNFIGALSIAAVGYVHVRLNKVEQEASAAQLALRAAVEASANSVKADVTRQLAELKVAHTTEERTLWDALDAERRRSQEFREAMLANGVTKSDLASFKADLKDHITHAIAGAANGAALKRVG